MIYLASPYSDPDPLVRKNRLLLARQATTALMQKRIPVFSPIVYGCALPDSLFDYTAQSWWEFNRTMLRRSEAIYVLQIPGVRTSIGVAQEVAFAHWIEIPRVAVNEDGEILEAPEWLK